MVSEFDILATGPIPIVKIPHAVPIIPGGVPAMRIPIQYLRQRSADATSVPTEAGDGERHLQLAPVVPAADQPTALMATGRPRGRHIARPRGRAPHDPGPHDPGPHDQSPQDPDRYDLDHHDPDPHQPIPEQGPTGHETPPLRVVR